MNNYSFKIGRKWTLLLTGEKNGLVSEYGDTFEGSPEHYERINVVPETKLMIDYEERISALLVEIAKLKLNQKG